MVDHTLSCSVESLDVLLRDCLLRNEGNVRLACRCADRLGIVAVILLPSHKRFDVLRANDLDLVAERFKFTGPAESIIPTS
jgi:hypothetical protein